MRYIKIPADITFKILATGEVEQVAGAAGPEPHVISFRKFVLNKLIYHPVFCTVLGARALLRFEEAYENAVASDGVMVLDEEAWKIFHGAVEKPQYQVQAQTGVFNYEGFLGMNGAGIMQLLPFIDAIAEASSKKPVALKPVDEAG